MTKIIENKQQLTG